MACAFGSAPVVCRPSRWELPVDAAGGGRLYAALRAAGRSVDISPAGLLARRDAYREKDSVVRPRTITPDERRWKPGSCTRPLYPGHGFHRTCRIGAAAPRRWPAASTDVCRARTFADANPFGGEPIRIRGEIRGRVTSAPSAFRIGRAVCLGYLRAILTNWKGSPSKSTLPDRAGPAAPHALRPSIPMASACVRASRLQPFFRHRSRKASSDSAAMATTDSSDHARPGLDLDRHRLCRAKIDPPASICIAERSSEMRAL